MKIYTDRGVERIAIAYKINNKMKGYNFPLKKFHEYILMKI